MSGISYSIGGSVYHTLMTIWIVKEIAKKLLRAITLLELFCSSCDSISKNIESCSERCQRARNSETP